jgi:hypothetical protein
MITSEKADTVFKKDFEEFMIQRLDSIKYSEPREEIQEYHDILTNLEKEFGFKTAGNIENCVNALRAKEDELAYRIGFSDAMKLREGLWDVKK